MVWARLGELLDEVEEPEVTLAYDRIAELIGGPLPASASKWRPQFWANSDGNSYSRHWRDVGFRTDLRGLPDDQVRFVLVRAHEQPGAFVPVRDLLSDDASDVLLVGCVKTKRDQPGPAKDLYQSPLWQRRRAYAQASGKPWFILSAEHGLLDPEVRIAPYDRYLADQPAEYRQAWAHKVLGQLESHVGDLEAVVFELHAGRAYGDPIAPLLGRAGARLLRPLAGLTQGHHLRWYDCQSTTGFEPRESDQAPVGVSAGPELGDSLTSPSPPAADPSDGRDLSRRLTADFVAGALRLRSRPDMSGSGWALMPEVRAVGVVQASGADDATVRTFLTLVAAMDRARDADRLWDAAAALYESEPSVYTPSVVTRHSLTELGDVLHRFGVSQRHGQDVFAWRTICESLLAASPIATAIYAGYGRTTELLTQVREATSAGSPRFPLLKGEKIATMWIRLLAYPGGAHIDELEKLPVAVDVQVRRVSEYLGVANTRGMSLNDARPAIQAAWFAQVKEFGAVGPDSIDGTSAALDPALWFFAKWGCTNCERHARKQPISDVCHHCRFDELREGLS